MTIFLLGLALALALSLVLLGPVSALSLALLGALAVVWLVRVIDPMRAVREHLTRASAEVGQGRRERGEEKRRPHRSATPLQRGCLSGPLTRAWWLPTSGTPVGGLRRMGSRSPNSHRVFRPSDVGETTRRFTLGADEE
jgi:hypothetical protein